MERFERREQPGKRIIIIGAGMAGLAAGYELAQAGHDPSSSSQVSCRSSSRRTSAGRSYGSLWEEATRDLREMIERDGDVAWDEIVRQYDQYSLREFLQLKGFSEGAVEMYGVMNSSKPT